jgi:hypothetical protein
VHGIHNYFNPPKPTSGSLGLIAVLEPATPPPPQYQQQACIIRPGDVIAALPSYLEQGHLVVLNPEEVQQEPWGPPWRSEYSHEFFLFYSLTGG